MHTHAHMQMHKGMYVEIFFCKCKYMDMCICMCKCVSKLFTFFSILHFLILLQIKVLELLGYLFMLYFNKISSSILGTQSNLW